MNKQNRNMPIDTENIFLMAARLEKVGEMGEGGKGLTDTNW